MKIQGHLCFDLNICSVNTPVRSKCISEDRFEPQKLQSAFPEPLFFLVRSIFVPVNDVYCNRIITVNLSLSHLLDCLSFSLSFCHFLINRDIVQAVHRMQELGCFCQKTAFCTPHAQGPRKSYTQRGRGGNTPTHIHSLIARWQTDSPHCLSVTFNPLFLERRKRSGSMICDITSHCRL